MQKFCKNFTQKKKIFFTFCKFFATFLQFFWNFFEIFLKFSCNFFLIFLRIFCKKCAKIFQKKERTRGHESIIQQPLLEVTRKWVPFVLIQNQFTKILQKNCKKIAKKLKKNCKKVAKNLQNVKKKFFFCVKFSQNFCKVWIYTLILDHVKSPLQEKFWLNLFDKSSLKKILKQACF